MALPETSATHVDAALSQISISYKNPSYICGMVAPVVPVAKQSVSFSVKYVSYTAFSTATENI